MMKRIRCHSLMMVVWALFLNSAFGQETRPDGLAKGVQPLIKLVSGQEKQFGVSGSVEITVDRRVVPVELRMVRFDEAAFDLDLTHPQYGVMIRRRSGATAFALPHHKVVFHGKGKTDDNDNLAPGNILAKLISPDSIASVYTPVIAQADSNSVAFLLKDVLKAKFEATTSQWTLGKDVTFKFGDSNPLLVLSSPGTKITLNRIAAGLPAAVDDWEGFQVVEIDRTELERQLTRGVRRATEVLAPGPALTEPNQESRKVEHGELRWIDGHRVVLLSGTSEQIGVAHGQLLREEALRCVDSVLYSFGTAQTILTGRWFRHDLEKAYARLSPHIPEDHKIETRALARSLRMDPKLAEALNVFPEMFHCSGFAVFGSATTGGKLYHGRVLDYMTSIGLQDSATTFIMAPAGKISFANVGYGGFIGSVSGMNSKAISLGEMGGRGEGRWDGVPMATLMRRALEECSTLDEVIQLWKSNPRTCEYYYVFADGKTNRAVGVAAVPESVEFILPGESHARLGEGIKDAVVLSAGSRLEELRSRVIKLHGGIDAPAAQSLMCRPVAMQSNLHNVLFVPADGVLYVANADHKLPAADRPYIRLDLNELLRSMNPTADAQAVPDK